ncbi:MAG: tail fiber domain-containing protein [bacterium]|nr:tail fiber domain-containing protein [bacterium]
MSAGGNELVDISVDENSGLGALPSSSFRLGRPAVNEGLFVSDATSMSLTLLHDEGGAGSSSAAMFSDLIDSQLNLMDDGITSYRASSSSGLEMRSSSNVATCTIDRNGNQYLSNTLSVGVAGSGHHIDVVGGAYCDGTNWVNASDKNSKENFEQVNGEEILEKISDLEITKWNYKGDDDAQHIGPTAQDFKKTFGVGADDKSISTIDPSGIALAAIKELYKQFSDEMKQKDAQIEELQKEMKKLRKELEQKKN